MLLQLLIMLIEFSKLIWQDVSVWNEVEMLLSVSLLHPHHVEAETILSRDFVALREMIDFLVLVKPFVKVALAAARAPQHVPLMALSWSEIAVFKDRSNQFVVKSKHFIEQFAVLDMVALLVAVKLHVVGDQLFLGNRLED